MLLVTIIILLSIYLLVSRVSQRLRRDQFDTANAAVVISGCDSGIGLELAKYFYKTCKFKIICGFLDIDQSEGFKVLSNLDCDSRLLFIRLNLKSDQDVTELKDKIKGWQAEGVFRRIHALINNAGTMTFGEFDWLTWDQIQRQIDVNLTGTIRLTRALVPFIIESRGRIINVSSVNDTTVFPGLSIYSASKSGLSTFSRGLGYELRKFGAHAITIRLGDFAKLTNIMSNHSLYRDDMWKEMSKDKRRMYDKFFHEFNKHLMKNYGMTSPRAYEDSSLFRDFELALLSWSPPQTMVCAPFSFKLFYSALELAPVWVQYHLLDLMFQFGFQWKPPQVVPSLLSDHQSAGLAQKTEDKI